MFEDLEKFVLDKTKKNVVLFGANRFFNSDNVKYDVVFHVRENVQDPYQIIKPTSLVLPVIRDSFPEVEISRLNAQYPSFTRFAVPEKDRILFYDIRKHALGRELKCADGYSRIPEGPFFERVNLPEMEKEVRRLRVEIDERY